MKLYYNYQSGPIWNELEAKSVSYVWIRAGWGE